MRSPGSRWTSLAPASPICGQTASSPGSSERVTAPRPNADLASTHSPGGLRLLPPADLTKPHRLSSRVSVSAQALPFQPTLKPWAPPRPPITTLPTCVLPDGPCQRTAPHPAPCSQRLPRPCHDTSLHVPSACNVPGSVLGPTSYSLPTTILQAGCLISLPFLQMRKLRLRAADCPSQRDTAHLQLWTGQLDPRAFRLSTKQRTLPQVPGSEPSPLPDLTPASSPDPTLPPRMLCSSQTGLIIVSLTNHAASVHSPHPLVLEYNY